MPLRYLSIPICSLCRSLNSLVTVHKVLNASEISKGPFPLRFFSVATEQRALRIMSRCVFARSVSRSVWSVMPSLRSVRIRSGSLWASICCDFFEHVLKNRCRKSRALDR